MPQRGRGTRRERYLRGRRFCGEASFAARKMRRTVSRLTAKFSSAWSFSQRWESLKPRYLPRARLKINCFWGREKAQGHGASAIAVLDPAHRIGPIAAV